MAEQIEGQIYSFSKDRKSINVNDIWLHNFTPLKEDIKKGIDYKITYTIKKTDNKEFNNIRSIVQVKDVVNKINEEALIKSNIQISDTSKNCILMQSVIIYLSEYNKISKLTLKEITKLVTESYKIIL